VPLAYHESAAARETAKWPSEKEGRLSLVTVSRPGRRRLQLCWQGASTGQPSAAPANAPFRMRCAGLSLARRRQGELGPVSTRSAKRLARAFILPARAGVAVSVIAEGLWQRRGRCRRGRNCVRSGSARGGASAAVIVRRLTIPCPRLCRRLQGRHMRDDGAHAGARSSARDSCGGFAGARFRHTVTDRERGLVAARPVRQARPNRTKPRRQTILWFCRPLSPTGRAAPLPPPTPCAAPRAGRPRLVERRHQRVRPSSSPPRWPPPPLSLVLATRQWPFAAWAAGRPPWPRLARQCAPFHRLLQFGFACLFDLARCGYHDMADRAAGRLSQFATRCCFWFCNFNYGLGLRAVGTCFCRFRRRVMQVEVFGTDQGVGDRLLG
jgi:hypothetical protein